MLDSLLIAATIHVAPSPCVVDVAIIPGHGPIVGCIAFGPSPRVLPPVWGGRVTVAAPVAPPRHPVHRAHRHAHRAR